MTGARLFPVIEVPMANATDLWPVADLEPLSILEIHGGLSEREIGSVLFAIAGQNRPDGVWDGDGDGDDEGGESAAWIEYLETAIRVHPTGGFEAEPVAEGFVEIPLADMPGLLLGVQERLAGFLDGVRGLLGEIAPAFADAVVASLDRQLQVSRRSMGG